MDIPTALPSPALTIETPYPAVARVLAAIADSVPLPFPIMLRHAKDGMELSSPTTGILYHTLPLPVHPHILAAALRNCTETSPSHLLVPLAHGWTMDSTARLLRHPEISRASPLTEKECLLLTHLARAYPAPCHRDVLLRDIWHYDPAIETHTLETHIYRLRSKLQDMTPPPCDIHTVEGGYALCLWQDGLPAHSHA